MAAGRDFQASHWWMWKWGGTPIVLGDADLPAEMCAKFALAVKFECGLLEIPDLVNMWETVRERKFLRCLGTVSLSSPACGCFPGTVV